MLYRFKMQKISQNSKDKELTRSVKLVTQLAGVIKDYNGAPCCNDLRVDFQVDSSGRYWLIKAYSDDYLDFLPLQTFKESRHKTELIQSMTQMHERVKLMGPSDLEDKKRCDYCRLKWPKSTVRR
jgi:hypothetical protein